MTRPVETGTSSRPPSYTESQRQQEGLLRGKHGERSLEATATDENPFGPRSEEHLLDPSILNPKTIRQRLAASIRNVVTRKSRRNTAQANGEKVDQLLDSSKSKSKSKSNSITLMKGQDASTIRADPTFRHKMSDMWDRTKKGGFLGWSASLLTASGLAVALFAISSPVAAGFVILAGMLGAGSMGMIGGGLFGAAYPGIRTIADYIFAPKDRTKKTKESEFD